MPFLYPEQLTELREQNPNLQYDSRGNVIGVSPAYAASSVANDIRGIMNGYQQPNAWDFGPTRADYQNSGEFIGPLQPQWWDPNGELAQRGLGALVSGQDLPDVGFYSQWNPDTNSWVRHGVPSGGTARPQNPYVRQQTPDGRNMQPPALHADAQGILKDAAENTWGINPLGYRPPASAARPYGGNADALWPQIQANPGCNPQSSPRGW